MDFWKNIFNRALSILYHNVDPDETGSWAYQYEYETKEMEEDVKKFHKAVKNAGYEISNEAMAFFLIYTESEHINNNHLIKKEAIDINTLITVAADINDELNKKKEHKN